LPGRNTDDQPGPGTYDLKPTFSGPCFSIPGRGKDLPDQGMPGPGTYNPEVHSWSRSIPT
jgi:hypothetical protein